MDMTPSGFNPTRKQGSRLNIDDPEPQPSTSSQPSLDARLVLLYETLDDLKKQLKEAKDDAQRAHLDALQNDIDAARRAAVPAPSTISPASGPTVP